ncbi:MAG TPA: tetratricopeptide repeat protein [Pyrinomonadaceae bacterium]|nr:tetratricopeptide repeat protein [Pyrinomonadaceae bacterium]
MHLSTPKLDRVSAWVINFTADWISPLRAYLNRSSNSAAASALDSYIRRDLDSAADKYKEALVWNPNDPALLTALGQVYYEQGKIDEAETHFRKALDYDFQHARALKALGILLQEKNELADAMYFYLRYLELQPKDALVCSNLGATFHNLGDYENALDYYQRAEKEEPKDPLIKKNRALALLALGRAEEAREKLKEAHELAPDDAEVNRLLGSALAATGDLHGAIEFYDHALKKDPLDADSHFEFAGVLARLNRFSEAARHAQTSAELFLKVRDTGRAAQAYWELGWDYCQMGDLKSLENSVRASTEALQYDPTLAAVYFNIGLALLQLGRESEALKRYQDGIQNLTQLVDLKYFAINDLKNALAKNPEMAGGAEILAMLENEYNAGSKNIAETVLSLTPQLLSEKITA